MALVDPAFLEMPEDPTVGAMPYYQHLIEWARAETENLTPEQLDFHDDSPDKEWMWWSIRRQVSHMAWDALIFSRRRCAELLWPAGDIPTPIIWEDHRLGSGMKYDRMLDKEKFWELPDLFGRLQIGTDYLHRVVTEQSIETLRGTREAVHGTPFWSYVIGTLPRGASHDIEDKWFINYDLEGSLWMVFYEQLSHVRTIQRFKDHLGLESVIDLPKVGYLRLPHYWGDTNESGPDMSRLPES
jgi:hypothetical protein